MEYLVRRASPVSWLSVYPISYETEDRTFSVRHSEGDFVTVQSSGTSLTAKEGEKTFCIGPGLLTSRECVGPRGVSVES